MIKVYFVCDRTDEKAASIDGSPGLGVEHLGSCSGRALLEDGTEVHRTQSSTYGWLRSDLTGGVARYAEKNRSSLEDFKCVDLIGQEVPERFRL